jgi:hypothetical protein
VHNSWAIERVIAGRYADRRTGTRYATFDLSRRVDDATRSAWAGDFDWGGERVLVADDDVRECRRGWCNDHHGQRWDERQRRR